MSAREYKIVRFYRDRGKKKENVKYGLTLAEAQAHCSDPESSNHKEGWFDGYTKMYRGGGEEELGLERWLRLGEGLVRAGLMGPRRHT